MARYYEKTNYPQLFKKTYWGTFNADTDPNYSSKIVANRNLFVENYKIISVLEPKDRDVVRNSCDLFDHDEYYKTRDGKVVLLTSPYPNRFQNPSLVTLAERLGFKQVFDLYCEKADSYIRFFDSVKDFHIFIKDIAKNRALLRKKDDHQPINIIDPIVFATFHGNDTATVEIFGKRIRFNRVDVMDYCEVVNG
jgi:hypothetical protein